MKKILSTFEREMKDQKFRKTFNKSYEKFLTCEVGSTNVFADLELPNPGKKLAKAKLALCINNLIKKKKLKPIEAAKLLGIDPTKITLLNRGRLSNFSIACLVKFLNSLNQDIA